MKKLAIIIPLYNEENNLVELLAEIDRVFEELSEYEYRALLVDDGSVDNSWEVVRELAYNDDRVVGLRLSRNFGKEVALSAGLEAAAQWDIDAAVLLDADFQHPPKMIKKFILAWETGFNIVIGRRVANRGQSIFRKACSAIFYRLFNIISDINMVPGSTDFQLLERRVIIDLCRFRERVRIFRGIVDWLGYKKTYIPFEAPARNGIGVPSYSSGKLWGLAVTSMASFSLLPLRLTGYMGLLVTGLSALLLVYMVITDLFTFVLYTPQAYFAVFNSFLVGVVLSALGLIALYIGRIHTEVIGRPMYLIRDRIDRSGDKVKRLSNAAPQ